MKKIAAILFLLYSVFATAQKEAQNFCDGEKDGSYFPFITKKKLLWADTFYFEEYKGETMLNGKKYNTYLQTWNNGDTTTLYLREQDGKILQYEKCCESETIRYDEFFEPGHSWKSQDKKITYKLLSYDSKLDTPYCKYEHLMAIQAEYDKVTFVYYYQKGYGYIGATLKGKIMSCATPEW